MAGFGSTLAGVHVACGKGCAALAAAASNARGLASVSSLDALQPVPAAIATTTAGQMTRVVTCEPEAGSPAEQQATRASEPVGKAIVEDEIVLRLDVLRRPEHEVQGEPPAGPPVRSGQ